MSVSLHPILSIHYLCEFSEKEEETKRLVVVWAISLSTSKLGHNLLGHIKGGA